MFRKKRNLSKLSDLKNPETVILVFALLGEAKPFLEKLSAKGVHSHGSLRVFEFSGGYVLVTGSGKLASAMGVTAFAERLSPSFRQTCRIWNLGSSGSFGKHKEIGSFYWIHKITDQGSEKEEFPLFLEKIPPFSEAPLLTVDRPLFSDKTSPALATPDHLVDMEGFGFFKAASLYFPAEQIRIGKWVSDYLQMESLEILSQIAASQVDQIIDSILKPGPVDQELTRKKQIIDSQAKIAEELGYTTAMIWEVKHFIQFALNSQAWDSKSEELPFPPLPIKTKEKQTRKQLHEAWKADFVV